MNNVFTVLGWITGVSKNGVAYTMLQVSRPFNGNTAKQQRFGQEVLSQYVEGSVSGLKVGMEVEFLYTINSSGYPTVCGVAPHTK